MQARFWCLAVYEDYAGWVGRFYILGDWLCCLCWLVGYTGYAILLALLTKMASML